MLLGVVSGTSGQAQALKRVVSQPVIDALKIDGNINIYPHTAVTLSAGFSLGTRYDVRFDAGSLGSPVTLGTVTLGAVGAYGSVEYRPVSKVRLRYDGHYERVRLDEIALLKQAPGGLTVSTGNGSFQDHSLLVVYSPWRAVRLDLRYRLRYRADTDPEHHVQGALRADNLWRGLGAQASIGIDASRVGSGLRSRALYSAGLTFVRSYLDLGAGITFTDGIGSGLTFSTPVEGAGGSPQYLFPYVLETNRVIYLRAFATFWRMYAGLDIEENLEMAQLRALVQIGGAL